MLSLELRGPFRTRSFSWILMNIFDIKESDVHFLTSKNEQQRRRFVLSLTHFQGMRSACLPLAPPALLSCLAASLH
jgi:hypothetical protein